MNLKQEIEEIENQIQELKNKLEAKKNQLALELSEFKIGDLIKNKHGDVFKITDVFLGHGNKPEFRGRKILKDGISLHKSEVRFYSFEGPFTLVEQLIIGNKTASCHMIARQLTASYEPNGGWIEQKSRAGKN